MLSQPSIPFRIALTCAGLTSLLCAQPCTSAVSGNARGTTALKGGNLKAAIADFIEELRDAEDETGEMVDHDFVLAFNYLHQRDFLQARFWAQQALDTDPDSPAAIHNLAIINAGFRSFHWPASPNGSYVHYVGCGV